MSEVGQLMVLDHDGRFVGSPSEEDLVRAMLPGFEDVTALVGTLANAFRAGTCIKLQAVPRTRSTWALGKEPRGDDQGARGARRPGRRSSLSPVIALDRRDRVDQASRTVGHPADAEDLA